MEAWRDELYHYGVRGMKWKHKKASGSAIAKDLRSDALELANDRSYMDDKRYRKWSQNKERRLVNTARAVEKGRNAPRRKTSDVGVMERGQGLYRRGVVSGTTARRRSTRSNAVASNSGTYSGRRSRKAKAAKYVKRVLS